MLCSAISWMIRLILSEEQRRRVALGEQARTPAEKAQSRRVPSLSLSASVSASVSVSGDQCREATLGSLGRALTDSRGRVTEPHGMRRIKFTATRLSLPSAPVHRFPMDRRTGRLETSGPDPLYSCQAEPLVFRPSETTALGSLIRVSAYPRDSYPPTDDTMAKRSRDVRVLPLPKGHP
ncbi:hypothetical protein JHW43_003423 [Diplocarpon mali]|nr:hypothetical protein JHW43_003423 [Diplocarpon mali]